MTVGVRKFGNPVVAPTIMDIVQYVHVSGTQACGLSGWAPTVLRRVTLKTDETLHLSSTGRR